MFHANLMHNLCKVYAQLMQDFFHSVCSLLINEKCSDAGISASKKMLKIVLPENSVNTTEKSSIMTEYRVYVGISPDREITDV